MSQYPPPGNNPPPGNYGQYPGQPPGSYPPPGGQQYWQESPKSKGLAITAMILGILALLSSWTVLGGIGFGLFAVILGVIALMKARKGTSGGSGMALTGLILGLLSLIIGIVVGVIGWTFFKDNGGSDFVSCVRDAKNDQSKIDQCEQDWNQKIENKYSITLTPAPTN
ncbi:DUF4190 domain-containing protein [Nocardia sp. NBC_01388]|uniref:DUF4190 domain-containing protein n=1 Tax=Nocardia sp. NBC_01388 TaxID=2903596 RepID=UPI0032470383